LLVFLEESKNYAPEKILTKCPFDDLYEERALLMSRLGEHEEALSIYAHKLKDVEMAENYCAKHFNSEKEESRNVYLDLLQVYLKPSNGIEPMVTPALQLLSKYYQYIDIPRALDLLPPSTPISNLFTVFEAALRNNSKTRRNNQVVKNLLKSENLQIREQLIRARSKVIKINDGTMCPVCSKRLGQSVFACYPNGIVVHYICSKGDRFVCPVTGTKFNTEEAKLITNN